LGVVQLSRGARLVDREIAASKADVAAQPDRADHDALAFLDRIAKKEASSQFASDTSSIGFGR
jgi:hypothetical protein